MHFHLEAYPAQLQRWPESGRHILAQFDAETIVVYQAYSAAIGRYAVEHQRFGGEFSFARMSWIKPNFLWMMYRSGWGTKASQEVTLAVRLRRSVFDGLLAQAVHAKYEPERYSSSAAWSKRIAESDVRLQWDPDHDPSGAKVGRRALQLGLRGAALHAYATEGLVSIEDISGFVAEQRPSALDSRRYDQLLIPQEDSYPLGDALRQHLAMG